MSKDALSHEEQRKYLWVNAWISTANSPDCKKSNNPNQSVNYK